MQQSYPGAQEEAIFTREDAPPGDRGHPQQEQQQQPQQQQPQPRPQPRLPRPPVPEEILEVKAYIDSIIEEIDKVIVGKREVLRMFAIGLLSGGNILLEDFPGLADFQAGWWTPGRNRKSPRARLRIQA